MGANANNSNVVFITNSGNVVMPSIVRYVSESRKKTGDIHNPRKKLQTIENPPTQVRTHFIRTVSIHPHIKIEENHRIKHQK